MVDSLLCLQDDVLKVFAVQRDIELESQAISGGSHGDTLSYVPYLVFLALAIAHNSILVIVFQLLKQLKHFFLHEFFLFISAHFKEDIVLVFV